MELLTRIKNFKIDDKHRCWQAFGLAILMGTIMFLPFLIYDKGYFFFFGDFNVQQVPFYQLAHQAVLSGDVLWNWYTDLGANFIASYSFYLLFSPFFWITLLFPTAFVPYLMAPLLILKMGCMALTSCWFLQRFVRDRRYAVLGALLYAFSGFSIYNIFFNHFHEAMVFFPLLLIALEELVVNGRRGWFALAVAVNCIVNYWFFIGEVMFVIIYVFVRMTDRSWGMTVRRFIQLAFESVVGLLISAAVLLPSIMILIGNPRTTSDNLINGWDFWIYGNKQRPFAILQSIFFPPDLPSRPNFFPDHGGKWASLSAWLPMFSATGVVAYMFASKKSWLKKLLLLCLALAMMPGPNSLFVLFNSSYYARWFYMPILLMCLATVIALERHSAALIRGLRWCTGFVTLFIIMCGLTPKRDVDRWVFGLMAEPVRFWFSAVMAILCLLVTWYAVYRLRGNRQFINNIIAMAAVVSIVHGIYFITNGKMHANSQEIRETALTGREGIVLPEETFARMDLYEQMDNLGMYWHRPNIQAFHSVVPNSIMEFYPRVGVKRDVSSKPETANFALRPLLSVRWFVVDEGHDGGDSLMPGYRYHSTQMGFDIYENENFLSMGFGYDMAFSDDMLMQIPERMRANMMLRAVHLEQDAIERNSDIVQQVVTEDYSTLNPTMLESDVLDRRDMSCYSFEIDNTGFSARSNLSRDCLMFFSVPYEEGWSATVNGRPAVVEKANIGFMAVRVPAGEAEIRFDYMTPGLITGSKISAVGAAALLLYLFLGAVWRWARASWVSYSRRKQLPANFRDFSSERFAADSETAIQHGSVQNAPRSDGSIQPTTGETYDGAAVEPNPRREQGSADQSSNSDSADTAGG